MGKKNKRKLAALRKPLAQQPKKRQSKKKQKHAGKSPSVPSMSLLQKPKPPTVPIELPLPVPSSASAPAPALIPQGQPKPPPSAAQAKRVSFALPDFEAKETSPSSKQDDSDGKNPTEIADSTAREQGIGHAILGEALRKIEEADQEAVYRKLFEWLIHPVPSGVFFKNYWEAKPLYINREKSRGYFDGWFSSNDLTDLIRRGELKYGVDIDLTQYRGGKRTTPSNSQEMKGKTAELDVVKKMMGKEGCSLRLLSPQRFSDKIWKLLSGLEACWQYGAGCNVYFTPPGTQGFAPHYDDIEAFILQLEGKKRWRVYAPSERTGGILPRYSSGNFKQEEIGEPVMDITLSPGDMLYFPRGWIHQAVSDDKVPSLHATLSTAQKHSWCDFMEVLLPQVSQQAFEDLPEIRHALPRGYQNYMGIMHGDVVQSEERIQFIEKAVEIFQKMLESMNFDRAADEMAIRYLHDRMPVVLSKKEKKTMKGVTFQTTLSPKSKVRLLRGPTMFRLTVEEDTAFLYYSCYNSRLYHEKEPQGVEFDVDVAPAIELLLNQYPKPLVVGEDWGVWHVSGLNLTKQEKIEEQLRICNVLYQNHLMVKV